MDPGDVKKARYAIGWTQGTAATLRGLSERGSWARYESGSRPVPPDLGRWLQYWAIAVAELERLALGVPEAVVVARALWEWRPDWLGPVELAAAPAELADLVAAELLTSEHDVERPDWLVARLRGLTPGAVSALAVGLEGVRVLAPEGPTAEAVQAGGLARGGGSTSRHAASLAVLASGG